MRGQRTPSGRRVASPDSVGGLMSPAALIVLIGMAGAYYWLSYSLSVFPWIVIADSNWSYADE